MRKLFRPILIALVALLVVGGVALAITYSNAVQVRQLVAEGAAAPTGAVTLTLGPNQNEITVTKGTIQQTTLRIQNTSSVPVTSRLKVWFWFGEVLQVVPWDINFAYFTPAAQFFSEIPLANTAQVNYLYGSVSISLPAGADITYNLQYKYNPSARAGYWGWKVVVED